MSHTEGEFRVWDTPIWGAPREIKSPNKYLGTIYSRYEGVNIEAVDIYVSFGAAMRAAYIPWIHMKSRECDFYQAYRADADNSTYSYEAHRVALKKGQEVFSKNWWQIYDEVFPRGKEVVLS